MFELPDRRQVRVDDVRRDMDFVVVPRQNDIELGTSRIIGTRSGTPMDLIVIPPDILIEQDFFTTYKFFNEALTSSRRIVDL